MKKVVSVPRIKRKIKKFFKNKWVKAVLLSIGVFITLNLLSFFGSLLLVAILGKSVDTQTLFKTSLIINAIIYPLWFKECLRVVEKHEIKQKEKRIYKEAVEKSGL